MPYVQSGGARLYYRTVGSGPVLLLLAGGDGDADALAPLPEHLGRSFTVVTHDRRGLSRSPASAEPATLAGHADDAAAVLAALTAEPATVFGNSIGAIIALELCSRHPERVRRVVAHEPPINAVLPDEQRQELEAAQLGVEVAHRTGGVAAAMQALARMSGFDPNDREADVPIPPPAPQRLANLEYFLTEDAPAVRTYRPDLDRIVAQADRIVMARGASSTGPVPAAAEVLAARLGTPVVTLPGGHNAPYLRPSAFADALSGVLS